MLHYFSMPGTEQLALQIENDFATSGYLRYQNRIYVNNNPISDNWISNEIFQYTTSNYCKINIHNGYAGEAGNFYIQEIRHESESGYMNYYYEVKRYDLFTEDTDKGKVSMSEALRQTLAVKSVSVPSFTVRAEATDTKTFQALDASKYNIYGIVGFSYSHNEPISIVGVKISENGIANINVHNHSSGNITTAGSLNINVLVSKKGYWTE